MKKVKTIPWTERLFRNRFFLVLMSLVFAVWMFVNVNQNGNFIVLENTTEYVANDINLDVEIDANGQVVEGNPSRVSFRVTGSKADVERFKNDLTLRAKIDVRERFGEKINVPITVSIAKNYNVVIVPIPKEVTVSVYRKISQEKNFQIKYQGPSAQFTVVEAPKILDENQKELKNIVITGADAQVNKVKTVEFRVTLQDEVGVKSEKIVPTFLDEHGNELTISSQEYTVMYKVDKNQTS